ncbi:hypothetical protein R5R35_000646 [Gryllus longicercus]|uniref:CBF1-interacting co-repressor CIR N-terminal domain-containing protein n=1 Tax=Gryllus longicercus TaxID=2509291 RepID=A0AAN9VXH5_9ORTH
MGKGFNNYMCKKFFHPASRDNLKRVWMAEQKAESYKKKQEELRVQYEKEQDLYTNKAMLSKESKDKLSVNFMYEPPPGTKKEREREDDEPEYKFEWQRKFNAPREDYCKGDSEIRDQPFGIQVRNVRCIKCHKWGHINTDKECPMYNQSSSAEQTSTSIDPLLLVQQMREDGLAMKRSALGLHFPMQNSSEYREESEKLNDSEIDLLKSLSKKQKQKLLKKFREIEKGKSEKKSKLKKSKRKHKNTDTSSDSSSSDTEEEKKAKKRKQRDNSPKGSSDESERNRKMKKRKHRDKSSGESSDEKEEMSKKEKKFKKHKKEMKHSKKHHSPSDEKCTSKSSRKEKR